MFDMRDIGRRISNLRKEKNMTQLELADALGISYQAVSNWERGDSMPDIAKLSDISKIFDITIDELLGNHKDAKVVEEVIEHQTIDPKKYDKETLSDVIPLMKPDQVKASMVDAKGLPLETIIALAPFLEEEAIDLIVQDASLEDSSDQIVKLAPFMSEDGLNQLVQKITAQGIGLNQSTLIKLAPYLEEETLDALVLNLKDKEDRKLIFGLAPFMSEKGLNAYVSQMSDDESDDLSWVMGIAPFLEEETVDQLGIKYYKRHGGTKLTTLAPFMSEKVIQQIVEQAIGEGKYQDIMTLLPFSSDGLSESILKYHKKKKDES